MQSIKMNKNFRNDTQIIRKISIQEMQIQIIRQINKYIISNFNFKAMKQVILE